MLSFLQRTSRNFDKTAIILVTSATFAFGNICSDGISRTDNLFADRVFRKPVSTADNIPNFIG
jgi:hypothetical protein